MLDMPVAHEPQPSPLQLSMARESIFPKFGQTRCYWLLLSSDLDYLYVDPVLQSHLGPQRNTILGKNLIEFIHPDECGSANQDLRKVLDSRTLHGSVTRVRYSSLRHLRHRLGFVGEQEPFNNEEKVAFDEHYFACDLVINWAAEGVVLCFIHAAVDMSTEDNDEQRKTHWTNWCGTPTMNINHAADLERALFHLRPAPSPAPPSRIFQILLNHGDRPVIFSWPPGGSNYHPGHYGRLANSVQIDGSNNSDAKTSCTRRYKAQQPLGSPDGGIYDVESIFIPHGDVIFACHKTRASQSMTNVPQYTSVYPNTAVGYYESNHHAHSPSSACYTYPHNVPMSASSAPSESSYGDPPLVSPTSPYHSGWPQHAQQQVHVPSRDMAHSPTSDESRVSQPIFHRQQRQQQPQHEQHPPQQPPQQQANSPWPTSHPSTPTYVDGQYPSHDASPMVTDDVITPRAKIAKVSPGGRDVYQGGRASGQPPVGVPRCASCKITASPEWRKGPSGKKDLCNACGLRYSRARAKKEGGGNRRRKEEGQKGPTSPIDLLPKTEPSDSFGDFPPMSAAPRPQHVDPPKHQQHRSDVSVTSMSTGSPSPQPDYARSVPPSQNNVYYSLSQGLSGEDSGMVMSAYENGARGDGARYADGNSAIRSAGRLGVQAASYERSTSLMNGRNDGGT